MGQAKRRGTQEERAAQAVQRVADAIKAADDAHDRAIVEHNRKLVETRISGMSPRKRSNLLAAAIIASATMGQI